MASRGLAAPAFTTWAYAPARTAAGRMGATTCAVPAVVLLSWLVLGELPRPLALAGVALSRSRPRVERGGETRSRSSGRSRK